MKPIHLPDAAIFDAPPPTLPVAPARRHVVAYSGGLDSTVLLHLAAAARLAGLAAVHVHHGLQAAADGWVEHCAAQCAELGIPLTIERVQVDRNAPEGLEAAARTARYAALARHVGEGTRLLVAHHESDQAETLLLRLLRGAGIDGLAGMAAWQPFGDGGLLWRPLLAVPKVALQHYAEAHGLRWLDDPHNADPRLTRAWLRHAVLPLLAERQPQVAMVLARTAAQLGGAAEILRAQALTDLGTVQHPADASLDGAALRALPPPRRRGVLRAWLRERGLVQPPSAQWLARLEAEVLDAAVDATPELHTQGLVVRRYRERLYTTPALPEPDTTWQAWWDGRAPLALPPGCGVLTAAQPFAQPLRVRLPRGGERLRPTGGAHHKTLKQLAQSHGLPPWLRCRLPVVEAAGSGAQAGAPATVLSLGGLWTVADGPVLHWTPSAPLRICLS